MDLVTTQCRFTVTVTVASYSSSTLNQVPTGSYHAAGVKMFFRLVVDQSLSALRILVLCLSLSSQGWKCRCQETVYLRLCSKVPLSNLMAYNYGWHESPFTFIEYYIHRRHKFSHRSSLPSDNQSCELGIYVKSSTLISSFPYPMIVFTVLHHNHSATTSCSFTGINVKTSYISIWCSALRSGGHTGATIRSGFEVAHWIFVL